MLGRAARRFLRTRWKSVQHLAEELFAMFHRSMTVFAERIVLTPQPGDPRSPVEIIQPADSVAPAITITQGNTTITIGGPNGGTGGGGGPDLTEIDFPGSNPGDVNVSVPPPQDNPIPLWGVVVAKVDGSLYQVRCWARDPLSAPPVGVLEVVQGLIDPTATIPAGTPTIVLAFPGLNENNQRTILRAVMQVPVWLE